MLSFSFWERELKVPQYFSLLVLRFKSSRFMSFFWVWSLEFQCFREGNRVPKFKPFLGFLGFKGGGGIGNQGLRI